MEPFDAGGALEFALALANACLANREPSGPVRRAREALGALAEALAVGG